MKAKTLSEINVTRIIKGVALGSILTAAMVAANSASAQGSLPGVTCWAPSMGASVEFTVNKLGKPDCEVVNRCGERVNHAIYTKAYPEHGVPQKCLALRSDPVCEPNGAYWKDAMRIYRGQDVYHMTDY